MYVWLWNAESNIIQSLNYQLWGPSTLRFQKYSLKTNIFQRIVKKKPFDHIENTWIDRLRISFFYLHHIYRVDIFPIFCSWDLISIIQSKIFLAGILQRIYSWGFKKYFSYSIVFKISNYTNEFSKYVKKWKLNLPGTVIVMNFKTWQKIRPENLLKTSLIFNEIYTEK